MTLPITHAPSAQEQATALQLQQLLQSAEPLQMQIGNQSLTLPATLTHLLGQVLRGVAQGQALAVLSLDQELTTQEAADLLGFSRPFLIRELLDTQQLPYRRVGKHRRLRLRDVLAFQRQDRQRREALADALSTQAQELGLY
jgi:excisionase family DNA binding protein